jgi:hypothetical protein
VQFTHTDIRQEVCDGARLFWDRGAAQLIFRNVTFTPLPGCDVGRVNFAVGRVMQCGDTYISPSTQLAVGVCSRYATCTPSPVLGTPLFGVACECTYPALPNQDYDPSLAPYSDAFDGCLEPMQMDALLVVSPSLTVTLSKPNTAFETRNLTLRMRGIDVARPATWTVDNAGSLPRWLALPAGSEGTTDSQAIAAGDADVLIPLVLSSAGLREGTMPFTARISVSTQSATVRVTETLPVSLFVSVRTDTAVWGEVADGALCDSAAAPMMDSNITVDEERRVPFTACDQVCLLQNRCS